MLAATATGFQDELAKLAKGEKKPETSLPRLWKDLVKKSPVEVKEYDLPDEDLRFLAAMGPQYRRTLKEGKETKKILVEGLKSKDHTMDPTSALAHEIGHAKVDKSLLGRLMLDRSGYGPLAPTAGVLGGLLTGSTKGKAIAAGLATAATLPLLGSEAAASITGGKVLEELGATDKELKDYRNEVAKAFLTYSVYPLGALGGVGLGSLLRKGVLATAAKAVPKAVQKSTSFFQRAT